ncbi:MAG TPA: ATP-binding protein [Terriglobales bacterium]|nr:ATP-binding protein [Terriglobales bacterium]
MGALMRGFDWSKTPMGPAVGWPQSLKTGVRIILTSRYPMFVWWGRELINLYNDPYRAFLGTKHPEALGKSACEVWAEIWEQIGPRAEAVLGRGESTFDEALLLLMDRHGYMEETYFTFSYSPLPDDHGEVCGLFCAVMEETEQVIGQRRLALLREMAAATAEGRNPDQVYQAAARCLSQSHALRDLPFSLIYELQSDGKSLIKRAAAGISEEHPAAPAKLDASGDSIWPLRQVMESGQMRMVELRKDVSPFPSGEWDSPPRNAVLVPITHQGQNRPSGVFVAGLNPYRKFGDEFRGFASLVASQIASGLGNALAYETERRRAESLAEIDRAKTLFFSNVSHEFRTPLTLMLGNLEELLSKPAQQLDSDDHEQLTTARRNALRLLKLVNTLLDFSRIEAGRVQPVYEPTDIVRLTRDIASAFGSAMEKAGLRYSVECAVIDQPAYVDRDMWEKIVLNLLSNAFKFTFEGEIALRLTRRDDSIELSVRDTGVGIPEEEIRRVFERFHRIENTRARSYEGTGIGLALVEELVKLHGGVVSVESSPGKGSRFTVTIPCGSAHLPAERIQASRTLASTALASDAYVDESQNWLSPGFKQGMEAAGELPRSDGKSEINSETQLELVLVADDNADMRSHLVRLLRKRYRVHAVADGVEALEAARRLLPVLIISDIMMPRMDGFELLQSVREDSALTDTPVVLLSARAGEDSRVEGVEAGADDYLVKPFTARELLARVATHVRMAKLRRETAEDAKRLHLAQTAAQFGTWEWDPVKNTSRLSSELHRIFGTDAGEPNHAEIWAKRVYPADAAKVQRLMSEGHRTGRMEFEYRYQQPELGLRWFYCKGAKQRNDTRMLGIVQDVTERKRVEDALRESEEWLRLAHQAARIGTFNWHAETDRTAWSRETEAMHGLAPGSFAGTHEAWEQLVHPEDRAHALEKIAMGFSTGAPVEAEWRIVRPDGSIRWIAARWQVFKDEFGKPIKMTGVNIDITEAKEAENARGRLASIVESSDDAIISKNLGGIITSWNHSAERLFGYTAAEAIGKNITLIIPPERRDEEEVIIDRIRRGQPLEHFETVRCRKDGKRIELSLTISPVKDSNGRIVGASKVARDITDRRHAERALAESQERLRKAEKLAAAGQLAASLAHEINNPLSSVTNALYLLRHSEGLDPKDKNLADIAAAEASRMSRIVQQSLSYYRTTTAPKHVDVAATMRESLDIFSAKLSRNGIQLHKEIGGDAHIVGFAHEIRQVIDNLLLNAIEAMPHGGRLGVSVHCSRNWGDWNHKGVRLVIADSGSGIADGIVRKIFEPFFTTKPEKGTGLGLWVVRGLVAKHDGTIRVRSSTRLGRSGTVISILLPLSANTGIDNSGFQSSVA